MFYNTKVKIHLTPANIPEHIFVSEKKSQKIYNAFHKLGLISFIGLVRFS